MPSSPAVKPYSKPRDAAPPSRGVPSADRRTWCSCRRGARSSRRGRGCASAPCSRGGTRSTARRSHPRRAPGTCGAAPEPLGLLHELARRGRRPALVGPLDLVEHEVAAVRRSSGPPVGRGARQAAEEHGEVVLGDVVGSLRSVGPVPAHAHPDRVPHEAVHGVGGRRRARSRPSRMPALQHADPQALGLLRPRRAGTRSAGTARARCTR